MADLEDEGLLGEGSFGEVRRVRLRASGEEFALKAMLKSWIMRERKEAAVMAERAIMDRLEHPGVVRLCFTFQDESSLYMATEVCACGELYEQIARRGAAGLPLAAARHYAAQVVAVLEYLEAEGVCHRDLKPENLLLTEAGHLKLLDFGSAKDLRAAAAATPKKGGAGGAGAGEEAGPRGAAARRRSTKGGRQSTFVGTADYVSPEMLRGTSQPGVGMDLWALGCLVYQMFVGRPPFRAASEYLTFERITALDFEFPEGFPPDAAALVKGLLVLEPAERLGCRAGAAGGEGGSTAATGGFAELKASAFFDGVEWERLWEVEAPPFLPPEEAPEDSGPFMIGGIPISGGGGNSNEPGRVRDLDLSGTSPLDAPSPLVDAARAAGPLGALQLEGGGIQGGPEQGLWGPLLEEGEGVVHSGVLRKHRGFLSKPERALALTSRHRCLYAEPGTMKLKGVITLEGVQWSVEEAGSTTFLLTVPGRTYKFEAKHDQERRLWLKALKDTKRATHIWT